MADPIVIVGSGLGGSSLVREIRKLDAARPITLLCADAGEVYAKPTLSVALAQKRTAETIAASTAGQFAEQMRITLRAHTRVVALEPAERRIQLENATLGYESLVLAVGARQMPLPGLEGAGRWCSVNSLDDYRTLRHLLDGCRRVLVIGAGFIGCEFANDLRGAGYEVDVVDVAPHPLARFWPPALARVFETRMKEAGIRWFLGTRVERLARDGDTTHATLANGTVVTADLVVSALGLAPNIDLARAAGLRTGRGIQVDATLAASVRGVYAIGDCAEIDGQVFPFVMPTLHCARALAQTLTGTPTPVRFPPMPVTLKTPACPALFLPAPQGAAGAWRVEDGDHSAVFEAPDGTPLGVALLGDACKRRESWVQRLASAQSALQAKAVEVPRAQSGMAPCT